MLMTVLIKFFITCRRSCGWSTLYRSRSSGAASGWWSLSGWACGRCQSCCTARRAPRGLFPGQSWNCFLPGHRSHAETPAASGFSCRSTWGDCTRWKGFLVWLLLWGRHCACINVWTWHLHHFDIWFKVCMCVFAVYFYLFHSESVYVHERERYEKGENALNFILRFLRLSENLLKISRIVHTFCLNLTDNLYPIKNSV